MMNFIALYRGPTISEARLVAVSSEREIVSRFIRDLTGEDAEDRAEEAERTLEKAARGLGVRVEDLLPRDREVR